MASIAAAAAVQASQALQCLFRGFGLEEWRMGFVECFRCRDEATKYLDPPSTLYWALNPKPSIYPLLGPKYPLFGTLYPKEAPGGRFLRRPFAPQELFLGEAKISSRASHRKLGEVRV